MSEAKHTPGPWEAGVSPIRGTPFVGSADTWVCGEMDNPNTPLDEAEVWANARLIAAAPDMLEALTEYLAAKPQCECTDPNCKMEAARIKARAAIAKTTGEP